MPLPIAAITASCFKDCRSPQWFKMPVKVTVAPGRFGFIYPTTSWKMITFRKMKADDFEVDEDHFYIEVAEV
jgi:hypothetical protein